MNEPYSKQRHKTKAQQQRPTNESGEEHHDHLIDLKGGKVVEFSNEKIERLQHEVAKKLGYRLVGHRLELYCVPLEEKA